jgi:hypothetical protein
MIKWSLQDELGRAIGASVIVSLDVETAEETARYEVAAEGNGADILETAVQEIIARLRVVTAFRGHTLGEIVAGWELDAALRSKSFAEFAPRVTEGAELTIAPPSLTTANIAEAEAQGLRT